jgi:hypothetical protein
MTKVLFVVFTSKAYSLADGGGIACDPETQRLDEEVFAAAAGSGW